MSELRSTADPVRFAILGFGLHARKRLVPAFREARRAQLVGLWRRDTAAAARDAAEFGVAHVFGSREELCRSPEVDAVFVTSPDALHHADVLLCAAHGKSVLCEKPLAMTAAEAMEMERAAAEAGVLLGVAQNMRWNRVLGEMRERIAAGAVGEPQLARAQFCYDGTGSPRRWIADGTMARGGPIGDVGVHCLDALRYVLGREVLSVQTMAREDARYGELEALASLQGLMQGGCLVSVTVSALAAYRTQLEVLGSEGVLLCENALTIDQPVVLELRRGGKGVERVEIDNAGSFSAMLDSFAAAVRGEGEFRATAADGVRNMRVLDAAYRGWRTGVVERVG